MPEIDLFHHYYDLLFTQKDYRKETATIFAVAEKLLGNPVSNILEIGCGTGNHSFEMANYEAHITAIDTDALMIEVAKRKQKEHSIEHVDFIFGDVANVQQTDYDIAVAMFNVVSYIGEINDLIDFMKSVESALKPGGVFIFDCWNGIAAIKDPPGSKTTVGHDGDNTVECLLTSETDFFNQKTTLTYTLSVKNDQEKLLEKDAYSFEQTLWTPNQVKYAIATAGLTLYSCTRNFDLETKATEKDWKIMFVCTKPR